MKILKLSMTFTCPVCFESWKSGESPCGCDDDDTGFSFGIKRLF